MNYLRLWDLPRTGEERFLCGDRELTLVTDQWTHSPVSSSHYQMKRGYTQARVGRVRPERLINQRHSIRKVKVVEGGLRLLRSADRPIERTHGKPDIDAYSLVTASHSSLPATHTSLSNFQDFKFKIYMSV
ncbi:hypothetical protein J6590_104311 [Homalodisca vitripennis]|nr:hypothetical protein J6590_104311 [Homalodisca vitripennis]